MMCAPHRDLDFKAPKVAASRRSFFTRMPNLPSRAGNKGAKQNDEAMVLMVKNEGLSE